MMGDEVFGAVREQALEVRAVAKAVAPMGVTGMLRRRIRLRTQRETLSARVRAVAPHAHVVERGRRPGTMPDVRDEAFRQWVEARGLAGKEFIVARAIGRRGTRGVAFMALAVDQTIGAFEPRVRAAIDRAAAQHNQGP